MSSHQNSAPGSKSAKFVAANPLAPMADPFSSSAMGNEQDEYAKQLSENVNNRLIKAMNEIKQRHDNGTQELDDPERAPTGSAYQYRPQQQNNHVSRMRTSAPIASSSQYPPPAATTTMNATHDTINDNNNASDSDDEDWLNNDNDDAELEAIRQRRLHEMRQMQAKTAQQRALGHGEVRTITQDEFLPECTGSSEWVAVHFFHVEFERCKIMDHHLKMIAPRHLSCKFLRLDAEKAPFFVQKLKIKTLPTLIVFRDGKAIDRLMGFEGLAPDPKEPDKWQTKRLVRWLAGTGAIEYNKVWEMEEDDQDEEEGGKRTKVEFLAKGTVWSGFKKGSGMSRYDNEEDYDDE